MKFFPGKNFKVGVVKDKKFFNIRTRQFCFTKYKKKISLKKYKKFF